MYAASGRCVARQHLALSPVLNMLRLPEVHPHDRADLQAGPVGGRSHLTVERSPWLALQGDRADGAAFLRDGGVGHQGRL